MAYFKKITVLVMLIMVSVVVPAVTHAKTIISSGKTSAQADNRQMVIGKVTAIHEQLITVSVAHGKTIKTVTVDTSKQKTKKTSSRVAERESQGKATRKAQGKTLSRMMQFTAPALLVGDMVRVVGTGTETQVVADKIIHYRSMISQ
jgi:hypothetical protein